MTKPIGWVWRHENGDILSSRLFESKEAADNNFIGYRGCAIALCECAPPKSLPQTLSIRDEAELRILAAMVGGYWANPAAPGVSNKDLLSEAKTLADLWMKARTVCQ